MRRLRVRLRWALSGRAIAIGFDGSWYAWSLADLMAGRYTEGATRDESGSVVVAMANLNRLCEVAP